MAFQLFFGMSEVKEIALHDQTADNKIIRLSENNGAWIEQINANVTEDGKFLRVEYMANLGNEQVQKLERTKVNYFTVSRLDQIEIDYFTSLDQEGN